MSYSMILTVIIAVLAVSVPLLTIYAFRKGYELGVKDWNTHNPDEPKQEPTRKQAHFPSAPDTEVQKLRKIMENIENYDGTGANQKEID